nr:immunoglobulin light chain junction region [Macaca mulatta]MOW42749.1 immunoglobulin light chain junction region [Macaca mulatta]MOW44144.1 immunoglobulin light chain junction region [Macaca mulatta]
CQQYDGDPRTF